MDPILIDCLASFPLTWCPCALGGQTNPIEAPSICAAVWGICSMACIAIQFAQSQDPNLSCPGVASMQPPLVSNEIAYIQPQPQCQLFDAPNASSHLISSHFIHIGSSIFLCSPAICPSPNQDTLPHSTIETIQYRYSPSPHRA